MLSSKTEEKIGIILKGNAIIRSGEDGVIIRKLQQKDTYGAACLFDKPTYLTYVSAVSYCSVITFNKSFNMPINQVVQQMNSIIMALAGCERIFALLDEKHETDEGYVTLVNVKEENGETIIDYKEYLNKYKDILQKNMDQTILFHSLASFHRKLLNNQLLLLHHGHLR